MAAAIPTGKLSDIGNISATVEKILAVWKPARAEDVPPLSIVRHAGERNHHGCLRR